MKSRFSPVKQLAVGRSQWPWRLCCDQANDNIRPMTMIQFCREHYGRSHFCRIGSGETRRLRRLRASTVFTLLLVETSQGRSRSIGKILFGPRIRPFDYPSASEIAKLPCPIQDLPGLLRREGSHNSNERLFTLTENHISIIVRPLLRSARDRSQMATTSTAAGATPNLTSPRPLGYAGNSR